MQPVYITDPNWLTTFPHLVAPLPDECLAGLLLRCDEANDWVGGTTLAHILRSIKPRPSKLWVDTPNLITSSVLNLSELAQLLAIPTSVLLSTTYGVELNRISVSYFARYKDLAPSYVFHLCPECLRHDRLLRRVLALPQIKCCLLHQVTLLKECQCGMNFRLFPRKTYPFTCHKCGLDWATLPRIPGHRENIVLGQKYWLHYEFFFSKGTPLLREHASLLINQKLMERYGAKFFPRNWWGRNEEHSNHSHIPLSVLVSALVYFDLTPQDILTYEGPLQRRYGKWRKFYYSSVMEIFANSLLINENGGNSS